MKFSLTTLSDATATTSSNGLMNYKSNAFYTMAGRVAIATAEDAMKVFTTNVFTVFDFKDPSGKRDGANTTGADCVVIDFDGRDGDATVEEFKATAFAQSTQHIIVQSKSHNIKNGNGDASHAFHVVVPLSRFCTIEEYTAVAKTIVSDIGLVKEDKKGKTVPACDSSVSYRIGGYIFPSYYSEAVLADAVTPSKEKPAKVLNGEVVPYTIASPFLFELNDAGSPYDVDSVPPFVAVEPTKTVKPTQTTPKAKTSDSTGWEYDYSKVYEACEEYARHITGYDHNPRTAAFLCLHEVLETIGEETHSGSLFSVAWTESTQNSSRKHAGFIESYKPSMGGKAISMMLNDLGAVHKDYMKPKEGYGQSTYIPTAAVEAARSKYEEVIGWAKDRYSSCLIKNKKGEVDFEESFAGVEATMKAANLKSFYRYIPKDLFDEGELFYATVALGCQAVLTTGYLKTETLDALHTEAAVRKQLLSYEANHALVAEMVQNVICKEIYGDEYKHAELFQDGAGFSVQLVKKGALGDVTEKAVQPKRLENIINKVASRVQLSEIKKDDIEAAYVERNFKGRQAIVSVAGEYVGGVKCTSGVYSAIELGLISAGNGDDIMVEIEPRKAAFNRSHADTILRVVESVIPNTHGERDAFLRILAQMVYEVRTSYRSAVILTGARGTGKGFLVEGLAAGLTGGLKKYDSSSVFKYWNDSCKIAYWNEADSSSSQGKMSVQDVEAIVKEYSGSKTTMVTRKNKDPFQTLATGYFFVDSNKDLPLTLTDAAGKEALYLCIDTGNKAVGDDVKALMRSVSVAGQEVLLQVALDSFAELILKPLYVSEVLPSTTRTGCNLPTTAKFEEIHTLSSHSKDDAEKLYYELTSAMACPSLVKDEVVRGKIETLKERGILLSGVIEHFAKNATRNAATRIRKELIDSYGAPECTNNGEAIKSVRFSVVDGMGQRQSAVTTGVVCKLVAVEAETAVVVAKTAPVVMSTKEAVQLEFAPRRELTGKEKVAAMMVDDPKKRAEFETRCRSSLEEQV